MFHAEKKEKVEQAKKVSTDLVNLGKITNKQGNYEVRDWRSLSGEWREGDEATVLEMVHNKLCVSHQKGRCFLVTSQ